MIEIKQIIKSRIKDIQQLKSIIADAQIDQFDKFTTITAHKKKEKVRSIKESDVLNTLSAISLNSIDIIQQLYFLSVQIFSAYDSRFHQYYQKTQISMKDNIRILYTEFFLEHGFKSKVKFVQALFQCDLSDISPSLLMGWISECSKKIYCEMLRKQLKDQIKNRTNHRDITNSMLIKKVQASAQNAQKKTNFNTTARQIPITSNTVAKKLSIPQVTFNNAINTQFTQNPFTVQKNSVSNVFLHNKQNVYGYFLEQFNSYYKNLSIIEDIDTNVPKSIKRMGKKEEIMCQQNINKAVQILLTYTGNSNIKKSIMEYEIQYLKKKTKRKLLQSNTVKPTVQKEIVPKQKRVQTQTQESRSANKTQIVKNPRNLGSLGSKQKQSQNVKTYNKNKVRFQILGDQDLEKSLKDIWDLKGSPSNKTKKFNLQFPKIMKDKSVKYNYGMLPFPISSHSKVYQKKVERMHELRQYSNRISQSIHEKSFVKCSSIQSGLGKKTKEISLAIQNGCNQVNFDIQTMDLKSEIKYSLKSQIKDEIMNRFGKRFNPQEIRRSKQKKGFSGFNIIKRK